MGRKAHSQRIRHMQTHSGIRHAKNDLLGNGKKEVGGGGGRGEKKMRKHFCKKFLPF